MRQVNWNHPLNANLSCWLIALPETMWGAEWRDVTGQQPVGVLTGNTALAAWRDSQRSGHYGACNFDGTDDVVEVAGGGGMNNAQIGTISMWVRWTSNSQGRAGASSTYGVVFNRQNGTTWNNQVIHLNGASADTAKICWSPYTYFGLACTSTTSPGLNVWRHVLATYKSGEHRLYVDGKLEASATTTGTINNDTAYPMRVGAWSVSSPSWSTSHIDCVRTFPDRMFSDAEVEREYRLTGNYCQELFLRKRKFTVVTTTEGQGPLIAGLRNRLVF